MKGSGKKKRKAKRPPAPPARPLPSPDRFLDSGLMIAVAVVPLVFYPWSFNSVLVKDVVLGVLVSLMGAVILVLAFWGREVSWLRSPVNAAVWAMIVAAFLAFLLSSYRYAGVGAFLRLASGALLYFVLVHHVRQDSQAKRLLWAMAAGALVACAYGALQHFGKDFVTWGGEITRIPGSYGNATYLASYIILLLPVMAIMTVFPPAQGGYRHLARGFFAVLCAVMLACLAWTKTVAAIGGVAIAAGISLLALVYFNSADRRKGLWKAGLVAGLLAATAWGAAFHLLPAQYRARITRLAHPADVADSRRIMIWNTALQVFAERPLLGGGPGTYQIYSRGRYAPLMRGAKVTEISGAIHAHNAFLETIAETGAVGGLAFIWLVGTYFWTAGKAVARARDPFWKNLVIGLAAGALAYLIQNVFAVTFFILGCQMFFWVALGLTVAAGRHTDRPPAVRTVSLRLKGASRWAASAGVAVIVLVLWVEPWGAVRAEHLYWRGESLAEGGHTERAVEDLKQAVAINPYCQRGWYQLGAYLGKQGEWREALDALNRSAALSPDYMRTQYNLGISYRRLAEYAESERAFRRALKAERSALNYVALVETYVRWGKMDKAARQMEQALEELPYDLVTQLAAANFYLERRDLERAELHVMHAAELEPTDPRVEWLRAQVHLAAGRQSLAREALERVVQLAPGSDLAGRAQALLARLGGVE